MQIGTPLSPNATRVMLLGSGELGKEVIIALQRLGVEVIAVDRYDNAPGQQVAHRAYTIDMTDDAALRANLADWCVREDWFTGAAADCKFMHCLPVRRNVAVADEVLDGPRSIVLREAHNRLTAQMAVLHRLLA